MYRNQSFKEIFKPFFNGTFVEYFQLAYDLQISKFFFQNSQNFKLNTDKKQLIIKKIYEYFQKINKFIFSSDLYYFIELCMIVNKRIQFLKQNNEFKSDQINHENYLAELKLSKQFLIINFRKKDFLIIILLFTIPFIYTQLSKQNELYTDIEFLKQFYKQINSITENKMLSIDNQNSLNKSKKKNKFYKFLMCKSH